VPRDEASSPGMPDVRLLQRQACDGYREESESGISKQRKKRFAALFYFGAIGYFCAGMI
jgi:hypothetical protein